MNRFKNIHAGEPVFILANGASILAHDLSKIQAKTIGVNRAWELKDPTYHVCLETAHYEAHPDVYDLMAAEGRLFVMGGGWKCGHVIPFRNNGEPWSDNLELGAVSQVGLVGSVAYVALQLAAWLGFTRVFFLGLDLGGKHFHSDWEPSPNVARQNGLFHHAARALKGRVEVWNVGSPDTKDTVWPRLSYEAALKEAA